MTAAKRCALVGVAWVALVAVVAAGPSWVGAAAALPPVTVTEVRGGPPHAGFTPSELGLFAGTASGDRAVYRRLDIVQGNKETWRWDGRAHTWTLLSVVPQPSDDPTQPGDGYGGTAGTMPVGSGGQTFLYSGGRSYIATPGAPDYRAEMFIFGDDGAWSAAPCNTYLGGCAPGPLDGGASASNGTDTLLFGGDTPDLVPQLNTLYRWNGQDWDLLTPAGTPPPPRAAPGFFFDGQDFIVFGGGQNTSIGPVALGDTWRLHKALDGSWQWSQVCQACGPSARFQMYAAGLYKTGGTQPGGLVVGGYAFAGTLQEALSDQWRWDGQSWTQIAAGVEPCRQYTGGAVPACLSDAQIPFTPYVASLPALGAAVWTAGSCTSFPGPPAVPQQQCTRVTTQLTLSPPAPPTPPPAPAPPAPPPAPVTATPAFTG